MEEKDNTSAGCLGANQTPTISSSIHVEKSTPTTEEPPTALSPAQKASLLNLLRTSHLNKVHAVDANLYLQEAFNTVLSYVIHYCGNVLREDELECWGAVAHLGAQSNSAHGGSAQSLLLRLFTRRARYHSVNMLRQDFCGGATSVSFEDRDGEDAEADGVGLGESSNPFDFVGASSGGIYIDVVASVEFIMELQQVTGEEEVRPYQLITQLDGRALLAEAIHQFGVIDQKYEAIIASKTRATEEGQSPASPTATANKKKRDYDIRTKSFSSDEVANIRFDQQREKATALRLLIGHRSVSTANDLKELCRSIYSQLGQNTRPLTQCKRGNKRGRDDEVAVKEEGRTPLNTSSFAAAPSTLFGTKERCLAYLSQHIDYLREAMLDYATTEFENIFATTWDLLLGKVVSLTPQTKHHLATMYQLFDLINRFDPRRALDQHVLSAHSNSTSAHSGGHSAGTPGARANQLALTVGVNPSAANASHGPSINLSEIRSVLLADDEGHSPPTVGEISAQILFAGAHPPPVLTLPTQRRAFRCYYACQGPLLADVLCPRAVGYYERAFDAANTGITSSVMMGKIGAIPCPMRDSLPKKVIMTSSLSKSKTHSEQNVQHSVFEHSHSSLLFPPAIGDRVLPQAGDNGPVPALSPYRLPNFYIFSCRDALELYLEGSRVLNDLVAVVCLGAGAAGAYGRNMVSDDKTKGSTSTSKATNTKAAQPTSGGWTSIKKDKEGYVLPMHQRVLLGMREAVRLQRLHQLWWWARKMKKEKGQHFQEDQTTSIGAQLEEKDEVLPYLTRHPVALNPQSATHMPKGSLQALCVDFNRPLLEDLVLSVGPCDVSAEGALLPLTPLHVWCRCAEFLFPLLEGVHEHQLAIEWLHRLLNDVPVYDLVLPHYKNILAPLCDDLDRLAIYDDTERVSLWACPSIPDQLLAEPVAPAAVARYIAHTMPSALGPYPAAPAATHPNEQPGPLTLSLLKVPYRYHKRGHWWYRLALNTSRHLANDGQEVPWGTSGGDKTETPAMRLKKAKNTEVALGFIEGLFHDLAQWRMLEESGVRLKVAQHRQNDSGVYSDPTQLATRQLQWSQSMVGGHITALTSMPEALYFPGVVSATDFPFTSDQKTMIDTIARFVFQAGRSDTSTHSSLPDHSSASTLKAANNVLWVLRQRNYIRRADLIECERVYIKLFVKPRRWGEPSKKLLSLHLREPTPVFVRGRRHEGGGWIRNDLFLTVKATSTSEYISATQSHVSLTTKTVLSASKVNSSSVNVEEVAAQWYRNGCGKKPQLQPVKGLQVYSDNLEKRISSPSSFPASAAQTIMAYGTNNLRNMMTSLHPPPVPEPGSPNPHNPIPHAHMGIPWTVGHMEGWWIEQTCQCLIKGYTQSPNSCKVVTEIVRLGTSRGEIHPLYVRVYRSNCTATDDLILSNVPPTGAEEVAMEVVAKTSTTSLPFEWLSLYQSSPSSAHHHHTLLTYIHSHLDLMLRYLEYLGTGFEADVTNASNDLSEELITKSPYVTRSGNSLASVHPTGDDATVNMSAYLSHHRGLRRSAFLQLMCGAATQIKGHFVQDYRLLFTTITKEEDTSMTTPIELDIPSQPEYEENPSKRLFPPPPPLAIAKEEISEDTPTVAQLALKIADHCDEDEDDNITNFSVFQQNKEGDESAPSADIPSAAVPLSTTNPSNPPTLRKATRSSTPFDSFERLMETIPILPLARLLRLMLLSPPVNGFGMKFNGFPDLVCWHNPNPCFGETPEVYNPVTSPNKPAPPALTKQPFILTADGSPLPLYIEPLFLLSEVKSPTDQLSEKQLTVNDALLRCGFLVHILHVVDAGKEDQDSLSTTATVIAANQQITRISSGGNKMVLGGNTNAKQLVAPRRTVPVLKAHGSATNPLRLDE